MKPQITSYRNTVPYTKGRNMFGEKCKTKLIILKRETALEQMLDAITQIETDATEFTFDATCFKDSLAEYQEVLRKVDIILSIKAKALRQPYYKIEKVA